MELLQHAKTFANTAHDMTWHCRSGGRGSAYSGPSGTAAGGTDYSPRTVGTASTAYGSGAPVAGSGPGFSGPTSGTAFNLCQVGL